MSTRSTTEIKDNGKLILKLYKQFDGYVEGWGKDIKDFAKSGKFVNGINIPRPKSKVFNGIGDFALQLVTEFKKEPGDLYATTKDNRQEYNYTINYVTPKKGAAKLIFSCKEDSDYYEEIELPKED
jgi:hypothetical protein